MPQKIQDQTPLAERKSPYYDVTNFDVTKSVFNKKTSNNRVIAVAQKVVCAVAAAFVAIGEGFVNMLRAIANVAIGVRELFSKRTTKDLTSALKLEESDSTESEIETQFDRNKGLGSAMQVQAVKTEPKVVAVAVPPSDLEQAQLDSRDAVYALGRGVRNGLYCVGNAVMASYLLISATWRAASSFIGQSSPVKAEQAEPQAVPPVVVASATKTPTLTVVTVEEPKSEPVLSRRQASAMRQTSADDSQTPAKTSAPIVRDADQATTDALAGQVLRKDYNAYQTLFS